MTRVRADDKERHSSTKHTYTHNLYTLEYYPNTTSQHEMMENRENSKSNYCIVMY